jgi:hypothetical protein
LENLYTAFDRRSEARFRPTWDHVQSTGFFDDFLAERPELLDAKNYRDLIIHHANIDLSLFSKIATETGYTIFSYLMSTITKAGPYNYIKNSITKKDVVEFA